MIGTSRRGFLVLSVLLLANSCSKSGGTMRIGVIPKGTSHEFWKTIHAGAEKSAQELGVEVIWKGPPGEGGREEQIKIVEDFVSRGVDGIVIAPLDDQALAAPLEEAKKAGIPVVVIDSDVKWAGRASYVATDNTAGGRLAAQRLGKLLSGKGKVLMLRYAEGSASTTQRETGFLDELKTKFSAIEIVSDNQFGGARMETAQLASENLLQRFPELDGIFCPNESTTMGMLRALQDSGRAGKLKFVGFDASSKLLEALRHDQIHGLVIQNPFAMGELGVRTVVKAKRGEAVNAVIDTGVEVATKENMDEPEVKALLEPDLAKWLK